MVQKVFIVVMAVAVAVLWLLTFVISSLRGGGRRKK